MDQTFFGVQALNVERNTIRRFVDRDACLTAYYPYSIETIPSLT
jgi:hypothetical protein